MMLNVGDRVILTHKNENKLKGIIGFKFGRFTFTPILGINIGWAGAGERFLHVYENEGYILEQA